MLQFEDALARVLAASSLLGQVEIPLAEAVGRVLAESVGADLDLPPFDTTAMDGWAVRARDVREAPAIVRRAGTIGAGALPQGPLEAGTALKVMTGAPMPEGSDAVVPVELSELLDGGKVRLDETPAPGAHVRRRGEVIRAGAPLLHPGRRLTAADLVLAAAAGRESLRVARRPRAAVLVTGDEIVPPGARPGPGQIRNTNGPLLSGALARFGAEVELFEIVRDERAALRAALARAFGLGGDLLLTTGGVSAGDWDLVGETLEELGATPVFHKVAIRPAKPILFAVRGKTLVFALPGNPVSAAVAFDFFVRPAVRKAAGISPPLPEPVLARLLDPVKNKGPRLAFHPARLQHEGSRLVAAPLPTKGSHDVVAHASSDGYLRLSPESSFAAGEEVPAYPATDETTLG